MSGLYLQKPVRKNKKKITIILFVLFFVGAILTMRYILNEYTKTQWSKDRLAREIKENIPSSNQVRPSLDQEVPGVKEASLIKSEVTADNSVYPYTISSTTTTPAIDTPTATKEEPVETAVNDTKEDSSDRDTNSEKSSSSKKSKSEKNKKNKKDDTSASSKDDKEFIAQIQDRINKKYQAKVSNEMKNYKHASKNSPNAAKDDEYLNELVDEVYNEEMKQKKVATKLDSKNKTNDRNNDVSNELNQIMQDKDKLKKYLQQLEITNFPKYFDKKNPTPSNTNKEHKNSSYKNENLGNEKIIDDMLRVPSHKTDQGVNGKTE